MSHFLGKSYGIGLHRYNPAKFPGTVFLDVTNAQYNPLNPEEIGAGTCRAVRAQILSLKEREFAEASRCLGLGAFHIVFRELVPNLMPYITIEFVRLIRGAVTASVGIMLLGLAPFSPTNWGVMLNLAIFHTGAVFVPRAMFYVLSPMAAIVFLQLGSLCFARGLEEVLNPRLREHE